MHDSAKREIIEYLTYFEGFATWMYLDSIGLVTTGIGVLLDPYDKYGQAIPNWYDKTTMNPAAEADIKKEFQEVKSKNGPKGVPVYSSEPGKNYMNFRNFEPITNLRAKEEEVKSAVLKIVAQKEAACRQYFPNYDTFPADVQVVLTQMSYGGGLVKRKDELAPYLAKRDWLGARDYTYLTNTKQGKDGYRKYNACFQRMMLSAYIVESCSKITSPKYPMPKDPKEFFGYKRALDVSRWNQTNDLDMAIREDDIITGMNISGWLDRQLKLKT